MSVKEQTIKFSSINVFVGKTDAGKSVVQRAIDAVRSNKYPADTYARHGCKEYRISILTDRGAVLLKKGKTTTYTIGYVENGLKKTEEFNAIGRDIPDKVKYILNMNPLKLSEESELEALYQPQHKPFFLISEDKGTFSRVISLISSSDKLNKLEKDVNSDILITKRKITQSQEILLDYQATLDVENENLKELDKYRSIESDSSVVLEELSDLESKIDSLTRVIELQSQIERFEATKTIVLNQDELKQISDRSIYLKEMMKSFKDLTREIPQPLEKNSSLPIFLQIKDSLKDLDKYSISIPKLERAEIKNYRDILSSINELNLMTSTISKLEVEKEQLLKEREKFEGQTCPICGNTIHFS